MENQQNNLQITVAYKPGILTQVPHLLVCNGQSVSLVSYSAPQQIVFNEATSNIQKVILTPWSVVITINQRRYYLATFLNSGSLIKAPGGQPQEFTLSRALQKNRLLRQKLKSLGIKYKDFTLPFGIGTILFIIVIFALVVMGFAK